jgi:hypothetical protein
MAEALIRSDDCKVTVFGIIAELGGFFWKCSHRVIRRSLPVVQLCLVAQLWQVSFPKIISGCIYDAAQPRWEWRQ